MSFGMELGEGCEYLFAGEIHIILYYELDGKCLRDDKN
jgi:hypothetical protein